MLMRMSNPKGHPSEGLGLWKTTLSWCDEGEMYPITVEVTHILPSMEIINVDLDYDRKILAGMMGMRAESMITATALEEFTGLSAELRKVYLLKQKQITTGKSTTGLDPLFEE